MLSVVLVTVSLPTMMTGIDFLIIFGVSKVAKGA